MSNVGKNIFKCPNDENHNVIFDYDINLFGQCQYFAYCPKCIGKDNFKVIKSLKESKLVEKWDGYYKMVKSKERL